MSQLEFEKRSYDAWLASAEVPYDILIPLLHRMNGSGQVHEAWEESDDPFFRIIPEACRRKLNESAGRECLAEFQSLLEKHGIRTVTILEASYPQRLRDIPDPPGILFFQGNPECMESGKNAAMIGSRSASWAGLKAAHKIAAELSRNGVNIISGLAHGIDTESHRGCLEGCSPTIAVMGCGLDRTYPAENTKLKKEILEKNGLILSEYAPGTKPSGYHFPYRNRIISGLSDIVILMEAKIRSGSMTTVGHALRQGKEVYVYPGDPVSPLSEGNRLLLREGGHYFTEAKEILEDMGWLDNLSHVRQNSGCSSRPVPEDASEKAVFLALEKGALGFDELLQVTGMDPPSLMSTLTVMQIRKVIDALPGKRYQLNQ